MVLSVAASEVSHICAIVTQLSRLLSHPTPEDASTHLILDRLRNLLAFVAARLPTETTVQADFYRAVMAVAFGRSGAGLGERRLDKELFNGAITAALAAGVDEVKIQTLRSLSG